MSCVLQFVCLFLIFINDFNYTYKQAVKLRDKILPHGVFFTIKNLVNRKNVIKLLKNDKLCIRF